MFNRPKPGETEEDLLRQQDEFLSSLETSTQPQKAEEKPKNITPQKVSSENLIIGDIIEKRVFPAHQIRTKTTENGFPEPFVVDIKARGTKKKSLFALKMEESSGRKQNKSKEDVEEKFVDTDQPLTEIHSENVEKIKQMSEEEIMTEKRALESTLSPELLAFLRARGAKKEQQQQPRKSSVEEEKVDRKVEVDVEEVTDTVKTYVPPEWMEMDRIEPEKLQWIGDIPDAKALDPDQPYSARFDFQGDLQPFKADIDVRKALYHHGDESDRPGYTIQELYQLGRSAVQQQRILAFNTLANIIRKTKMGYYDSCFDGVLLRKLVESDVFFLLRFAMDDRTITTAAVNCLHAFFVNPSDEICLNRLLNLTEEDEEPLMYIDLELDKDSTESELKDHQILAQDIVRGVLRTDVLVRFTYILREFEPDRVSIAKIFECLIRICRHSTDACEAVYRTPGLMEYVFNNINSTDPLYQGVTLLRVLFSYAPSLIIDVKLQFSFIFKFVDMDQPAFKLKLECLSLLKVCLRNNMLIDEVMAYSPCLIRLLCFYIDKVDVNHGRFDFELFAGLVSVLNTVLLKKIQIDQNYFVVVGTCLEKWLTQIVKIDSLNYSVSKALLCALRLFSIQFSIHGVLKTDLERLETLKKCVKLLISSKQFLGMVENLASFSHILNFEKPSRDPVNLPSLNSIYKNGGDHLRTVQDKSIFPLFLGLSDFLLKCHDISHDITPQLELFFKYCMSFLEKVNLKSPISSWFSQYELLLCTFLLDISAKVAYSKTVECSLKCIPHFRTDDRRVTGVLKNVFSDKILLNIFSEKFALEFTNKMSHSAENISCDWLYSCVESHPVDILKFISSILLDSSDYLNNIPHTTRYFRLCLVFLNEDNIFHSEIKQYMTICLKDILNNFDNLDLNVRVSPGKSFYELYTELITQYAGCSYGDAIFARFVTIPLAQKFDVSFRKLLWSEYMHVLRVITLPGDMSDFIPLNKFVMPVETDESLLVLYLNATARKVVTKQRNGFIYAVALENVKQYLKLENSDVRLSTFLRNRINELKDSEMKRDLSV